MGSKKRPVNQFSSHLRVNIFYGKLSGRCACSVKKIYYWVNKEKSSCVTRWQKRHAVETLPTTIYSTFVLRKVINDAAVRFNKKCQLASVISSDENSWHEICLSSKKDQVQKKKRLKSHVPLNIKVWKYKLVIAVNYR